MYEAAKRRPGGPTVVGTFLYVWLMVGFASGTLLLVGPLKWITGAMRSSGWAQSSEDLAMKGVILLYVVGSLFLARWVAGRIWRARSRPARLGIPAGLTLAAAACLWAWMDPGRMLAAMGGGPGGELTAGKAEFVFGPYPDRARLEELKRDGFTGVVSLQHPAVMPFEPKSIAEEKRNTADLDIEFVHAPMLPWVSQNQGSLEKLRELARTATGKYYVHCGLGRDRTNVARHVIASAGAEVKAGDKLMAASTLADRKEPMERGAVTQPEPGVWLTPYPNQPELFGYFLAGQVAHVVSLLDPADPRQAAWQAELERELTANSVPFTHVPVAGADREAARRALQAVRRLPHPVAVIAPRTQWDKPYPGTEAADTFTQLLRASAPPATPGTAAPPRTAAAR